MVACFCKYNRKVEKNKLVINTYQQAFTLAKRTIKINMWA